jgi:RHS repeat-associated protein
MKNNKITHLSGKTTANTFWAVVSIIFILSFTGILHAQVARGFQAANSYAAGGIDAINVTNGNVLLNIPIASLPAGRGTSPGYSINLQYNSKLWDSLQFSRDDGFPGEDGNSYYSVTTLNPSDQGGWRMFSSYNLRITDRLSFRTPNVCHLHDPIEHLQYRWKLELEMPDGSIKQFFPTNQWGVVVGMWNDGYSNVTTNGVEWFAQQLQHPGSGVCYTDENTNNTFPNGMNYITMDGSHLRLFIPHNSASWKLYFPDGNEVENAPPDNPAVSQRLTDRNGNRIEHVGSKIIDQLGRYIEFTSDSLGEVIRVKGVGGEIVDTHIQWGGRFVSRLYTASTALNAQEAWHSQPAFASFPTIEKIIFPAQLGSQEMIFDYYGDISNPGQNETVGWGEVKSVVLPTGAKSTFTYDEPGDTAELILQRGALRKDLEYTEQYEGQSTQKTDSWLYSVNRWGNGVTDPSGAGNGEFTFYSQYSAMWNNGLGYQTFSPDGSMTERLWAMNVPYTTTGYPNWGVVGTGTSNAYVRAEFTTLADANGAISNNSSTAIKEYKYDKNGNVLEVKEYDWVTHGSVPRSNGIVTALPSGLVVKRKTVNTYYNQAVDADSTATNIYSYSAPGGPKIKNLIKSTEVRDGAGTPKGRSEYSYDNLNTGNLTITRVWDSEMGDMATPDVEGKRLNSNNSISTSTAYNQYGAPIEKTDSRGVVTSIAYGDVLGPNGYVTGLYPTQIEVASNYTALKRTSTSVYDFYTGLAVEERDVDNDVKKVTEYDALGRPVKVRSAANTPLESWVTTEYNTAARRVITRADRDTMGDGKKIGIKHYDELGRIRLARTLENPATEDPTDETDGIKVLTRYTYDNGSNPAASNGMYTLISNPYRAATSEGASSEQTMGWTVGYSTKTGITSTKQTFSGSGLPAPWGSNNASTGTITTILNGVATTVTNQAGKLSRSIRNSFGEVVRVDEPNESNQLGSITTPNQPTSYSYDLFGNLVGVTQIEGSNNQTRTFSYSSLSRLTSTSNPESGTMTYRYDTGGNLVQKTDARNISVNFTYDALKRVTQRSYSGESDYFTPTVTYTYDGEANAKGKLTKLTTGAISNPLSVTEYQAFDKLGRITQSQQTTDGTAYNPMIYTYDLFGALIEETYPSGRVVRNLLDESGDLSAVQSKKNSTAGYWNYADNLTYNPSSLVTSMQLGNGYWESAQYNSRGQSTRIALGNAPGETNLLRLDYSYGTTQNSGNILSQTIMVTGTHETVGFTAIQTYTYDSLNRLKTANETVDSDETWSQTFTYDRFGNRRFDESGTTTLTKTCGMSPTFTVCPGDRKIENPEILSANNQIKADQDGDNSADYTYDSAGNLTMQASGLISVYDGENKQVEAKNSNSQTIGRYWYDGDGKRVKKYVPGTGEITIFIYDAGGKLVAEYSTVLSDKPKVAYITNDNLGSPRINTDADGSVQTRTDYYPFGQVMTDPIRIEENGYKSDEVRKKFTGYERDDETGLDFAQARYFNAAHGRFITTDPYMIIFEMKAGADNDEQKKILLEYMAQAQNWNKYAYCLNNPLKLLDPQGMRPPNENEMAALAFLRVLASTRPEFKAEIMAAHDEIAGIIDKLGANQQSTGVNIAVWAILNVNNVQYGNDGTTYISDGRTTVAVSNDTKCNFFVAGAYVYGGGLKMAQNGKKGKFFPLINNLPPVANFLGDSQDRQHLSNISPNLNGSLVAVPGDIVAWRTNGGEGSGHSSIYIGGGVVIYAGSGDNGGRPKVATFTYLNNHMSGGHETPVVRRYNGKP